MLYHPDKTFDFISYVHTVRPCNSFAQRQLFLTSASPPKSSVPEANVDIIPQMSQKDDVLDSRIVSNNQIVYLYTAYIYTVHIYILCYEITRFNYPFEGLPRFAKIKRTYDIRGSDCVFGGNKNWCRALLQISIH